MNDTERVLVWMAAIYAVSQLDWDEVFDMPAPVKRTRKVYREIKEQPFLQRQGAKLYDAVHNDAGHKQDLPGKQLTRQAVLNIAKAAGFPNPKLAAAIALAESGGVPGAFVRSSREYSVGLWQINTKAWPQFTVENMKDPRKNAHAALLISKGGTYWKPWATFTSGKYRQFQTGVLAP